jgi:hypothetical protein
MLMPGKAKPVTVRMIAPGGQSLGVEKRNFGCIVCIEPMPHEMNGLSEEQALQAMQTGIGFVGGDNAQRGTLAGRACVTFDQPGLANVKAIGKAVVYKNTVYTFSYAYKSGQSGNQDKFFDSIKFN